MTSTLFYFNKQKSVIQTLFGKHHKMSFSVATQEEDAHKSAGHVFNNRGKEDMDTPKTTVEGKDVDTRTSQKSGSKQVFVD